MKWVYYGSQTIMNIKGYLKKIVKKGGGWVFNVSNKNEFS